MYFIYLTAQFIGVEKPASQYVPEGHEPLQPLL